MSPICSTCEVSQPDANVKSIICVWVENSEQKAHCKASNLNGSVTTSTHKSHVPTIWKCGKMEMHFGLISHTSIRPNYPNIFETPCAFPRNIFRLILNRPKCSSTRKSEFSQRDKCFTVSLPALLAVGQRGDIGPSWAHPLYLREPCPHLLRNLHSDGRLNNLTWPSDLNNGPNQLGLGQNKLKA